MFLCPWCGGGGTAKISFPMPPARLAYCIKADNNRANKLGKENRSPTPLEDGLECLASLFWGWCCQGDPHSQQRGIIKVLSSVWWSCMSQVHCWELLCSAVGSSLPMICHCMSKLCFQTFPRNFHKWSVAAVNAWKRQIPMSPAFGLGTSDFISIKNFVVIQGQN